MKLVKNNLEKLNEINPRDYIQIPQYGVSIRSNPVQINAPWYNSFSYLKDRRLRMGFQEEVMTHLSNVVTASQKDYPLHFADGTNLSDKELRNLYEMLTGISGPRIGTWIDARFESRKSRLMKHSNHKLKNGCLIPSKIEPVSLELKTHGYFDIRFDSRGFPIKRSKVQHYSPGENLQFWVPEELRATALLHREGGLLLCNNKDELECPNDLGLSPVYNPNLNT